MQNFSHFNGSCCCIWVSYFLFWMFMSILFLGFIRQILYPNKVSILQDPMFNSTVTFQVKLISLLFIGMMTQAIILIFYTHERSYGIIFILYISVISIISIVLVLSLILKNAVKNILFPEVGFINNIIYFGTKRKFVGQTFYFFSFTRKLLCVFAIVLLKGANYYVKMYIFILINLSHIETWQF